MALIDLKKTAKISLEKKGIDQVTAKVALAIDISGSMSSLFRTGTVQKTCERLLGLAMNLDDNQAADIFLFGQDSYSIGELTEENFSNFVSKKISNKYDLEPDTKYAGVISDIINFYHPDSEVVPKNKNIFSRIFSSKSKPDVSTGAISEPAYVLFLTDGDNSDYAATEDLIKQASNLGIFWQFVGIGGSSFKFLEKLDNMTGRYIDNANFFSLDDLDKISDSALYDRMLTEFPSWIKEAKAKNIIN